ncbi:DapH/DapD/GlmU-related protein [Cytophagaceae bacterium DM2B3-1]|uniref:DapH/DapD/GlmU-related protein n=1 Tax=Xanthocytophaga flava TaxID=3048013 RepID=A0ABT7CM41_9BACT|nr:DapH/DapD/GlmU-related protein [Xanthocytophaga flavus]MDJ1494757.1 DapH/DapD/GlmU-related protein [Xanthocytophaga flavus]
MLLLHSISGIFQTLPILESYPTPWEITTKVQEIISQILTTLDPDFIVRDHIAIHKDSVVEQGVVLKAPVIISKGCFIGAHAYLRGGVFLAENVSIGPGCEVKSSFIFSGSALAHFNFVGDSIIGNQVNMEAGAIIANHFNEREDKRIWVKINHEIIDTKVTKFGALIGDNSRLGANAVTTPGTILPPNSVVGRLELVNQIAKP